MHEQFASANSKIGAVNGLRGIAILMVVLHHLFSQYAGPNLVHPGEIDPDGIFAAFISNAWLGVNIFFVLSGFVLYLPYRLGRRRIKSAADFPSFYLHRAQRLLPLYYIVVLVSLTLNAKAPAGTHNWYLELVGLFSTLFIFSAHGFMPPSNMVLWSVAVEIWFSLLFPALILGIQRWSIEKILLASLVVSAVFIFIGGSISIERVGHFRPFTMGIFGACYEFVLGMFVCHLYVGGTEKGTLRHLYSRTLLPSVLIAAVALFLMHHGPWLGVRILGGMLFAVGIGAFLLGVLSGVNPVRRVLENWPLQVLGCMCYSVYAWHGIVMGAMIPPSTSMLADTIRLLAPYSFVTLMLSILSYRYIEFGRQKNWRALFLLPEAAPEYKVDTANIPRPTFETLPEKTKVEN